MNKKTSVKDPEDIRDLQARLDEIWQCARELLSRLASIR